MGTGLFTGVMRHLSRKAHNGPGQKPQTESVHNPRETARCDTIKATGRLPRSVNRSSPTPQDPMVSQSRPRTRPDASPEPADIPLPPPALTPLWIASPAQCFRGSFPVPGAGSPSEPTTRTAPSPLTGRPRGVLGDRRSRENQARGAKADWIHDRGVASWPTGGVNDWEGRGLPAVTLRGGAGSP